MFDFSAVPKIVSEMFYSWKTVLRKGIIFIRYDSTLEGEILKAR